MSIPSRMAGWVPHTDWGPDPGWGLPGPASTITRVDPFSIHSVEFGTGTDALVLLHGLSGSAHWWHRNVSGLAKEYRVLLPELVGFGSSPATDRIPRLDETADLLAAWLGKMGLERVHLVGHSMGGHIAIHLATRHPERIDRLVLVDAAGIPRPLSARALLRFALEVAPVWRWGDPSFLPTIIRDAWTAGPRTVVRAIGHIMRDDVRPLLPRITAPTLVLWGARDNLVPLSYGFEMRAAIPDSQLAILRGAAHNPMVDRPADFNRLVMRFLGGERVGR